MSKIINNLLKFLKANIGLSLVTLCSVIWVLFKEPLLYIAFVKKIEPICDSVSLGIISSYIFYYFTVYRPENKKEQQINKQFKSSFEELEIIFFSFKNELNTLLVCIDKNKENFEKLDNKVVREGCEDWTEIFETNKVFSINNLDNNIMSADVYLSNINSLNNFYINNIDLTIEIDKYYSTIAKKKNNRFINDYALKQYYTNVYNDISDILKQYSDN
ncbi:hypothetical protein [Clostridium perfringens]|uniref:Uncharacterized protein n=1 Tax=Clostridium perfringens TaxID=1502 RepID=A0AAP6WMS9_CLOPF|nr:hypothetical protein [Clostridium perfringens]MCX0415657.1 hypothetical protein [Clostridium perfringens]MDU3646207.1 hypothetical protein [Clostridium perfringens]NGU29029.1 hypothetical protein [Clostridium perfringens]PWX08366.1 hypothetical protein CYK70_07120 [Clostridium perfringens]